MSEISALSCDVVGRRRGSLRVARLLAGAAIASGALYLIALSAVWMEQERLLFHPSALDPSTPLSRAPDVVERMVEVPGARLSVVELRLPNPTGVVFFLHGDGGNLQKWFVNTAFYREANYDLVMMDYRGFGKSTGKIESEAQLQADVQAVWNQTGPRYRGRCVVLLGRSLGTGLAATLAAQIQPSLTILVSPYSSMTVLAREHYPWVPAAVVRYPLQTDTRLGGIRTPVLLIHGDRDDVIPLAQSRTLLRLGPQIRLTVIPGAGHSDLQEFESYRDAVRTALGAARPWAEGL